ncbi:DNA-3-methyladenine glycosylase [Pedobacter sp. BS3]|uniref:DNA-3-methyladenine glycosylase n=1 Tax=Pedobacter sp. BS3 TaxID=2567937 RepID=UPI0011F0130B|nr:DNA-3-methyladenine glycosylase [Pedobacter sp. BS3]TZF81497.1 DNA-3-methyladenine glycosylase [Pedobacter sp. BS3]
MKLGVDFYRRDDVVALSRELLGKYLFTCVDGQLTGGIIVETEAYRGPEDSGSHAYNHKRTPRNEMMYSAGGVVYMYICYGIHHMLNIVTGNPDESHAILIRAIEPTVGLETIRLRRNIFNQDTRLCRGPGALAQALGLTKLHNGVPLTGNEVWIEDQGLHYPDEQIAASARIGLNVSEPYQSIPWRFYLRGSKYVSAKNN